MGFGKKLSPTEDTIAQTDSVPGGDFKYLCFGYSAFDAQELKRAAKNRTSRTDPIQLPYCEGLEVVSAAAMSEKPELLTGGAIVDTASSSSAPPSDARHAPTRDRPGRTFTGRPDIGGPEAMDWDQFKERFDRMATKITDKMKSNATFMGNKLKQGWDQVLREIGGSDKHDR